MRYVRICTKCKHEKVMEKTFGGRSGKGITPVVQCPKCKTRNFVLRLKD